MNFNALNKYYDLIKQHFPENYLEDIKKQADKTNKKENTTKPNNEPSNKTEDNIYSSIMLHFMHNTISLILLLVGASL